MSEHSFVVFVHRVVAACVGREASDASRRDIARALAGLALSGGWATLRGIDDVAAKRKRKTKRKRRKNRCKNDEKKCGKTCIPEGDCCTTGDCDEGELCAQGTCVVGQGSCEVGDDVCINLSDSCGRGNCFCYTTTSDATRCGSAGTLSDLNACLDDDDCQDLFPDVPGAFCSKDTGPNCVNSGVCIGPCGFSD